MSSAYQHAFVKKQDVIEHGGDLLLEGEDLHDASIDRVAEAYASYVIVKMASQRSVTGRWKSSLEVLLALNT